MPASSMFSEARGRIEGAHRPYHAALERLIAEAHRTHGFAILLIDWHSMPAAAARAGRGAIGPAISCSATGSGRPARGR